MQTLTLTPEAHPCACAAHLLAGLCKSGSGLTNHALHRAGVWLRRWRKQLPCTPDSILLELHQLRADRQHMDWLPEDHLRQALAHLKAWGSPTCAVFAQSLSNLLPLLAGQIGQTWRQTDYIGEWQFAVTARYTAPVQRYQAAA